MYLFMSQNTGEARVGLRVPTPSPVRHATASCGVGRGFVCCLNLCVV